MIDDLGKLLEDAGFEDIIDKGDGEFGTRCPAHEQRTGRRENRPRHFFINTTQANCFSCGFHGSFLQVLQYILDKDIWDTTLFARGYGWKAIEFIDEERVLPTLKNVFIPSAEWNNYGSPPDRALRKRRLDLASVEKFDVRWDIEGAAWLLPFKDEQGKLLGWQHKAGSNVWNYPKGIKKGLTLFGSQFLSGDTCVLVESPLDVCSLYQVGIPAVASYGDVWSDWQIRFIMSRSRELVVALDNDEEGQKQVTRLQDAQDTYKIRKLTLWNYANTKAKDPGAMSAEEMLWGFENRTPVVHRQAKKLSITRGGPDVRRTHTSRIPTRFGKNDFNNRRSGKAV